MTGTENAATAINALVRSADAEWRRRLVTRVLGDVVVAEGGDDLVATLQAVAGTRSQREAAALLGVGVRTVRRRLDRVEELAGRTLSIAADRCIVDLALAILAEE